MWDRKYNLALKEQFGSTKIENDELETYNQYENQPLTDNKSKFIKYRSTLGNVKHVSIFMCSIAAPITIFITISPFIINNSNINIKLSSIFRFVCTIPIVSTMVFIYFNIPKYNEYIALKFEIRAIVQIICAILLASNLLISFLLYSVTDMINKRFLMLINGNIQIIASFLLFDTSTGFILLKLKQIMTDDRSFPPNKENTKFHLVFTSSDCTPNKNNIKSLAIERATDSSISAENKLRKTVSIWGRSKDMKDIKDITQTKTNINSEAKYINNEAISSSMAYDKTVTSNDGNDCIDFSLCDAVPPQYETKMRYANSESLTNNNRKVTFSTNNNKSSQVSHAHIDIITSATAQRIVTLNLLEQSISNNKSAKTVTIKEDNKRFEIVHTPIENDRPTEEFIDIDTENTNVSDGDEPSKINENFDSHSKRTSNTHIFTSTTGLHSSPAMNTPQISKTDSKPHSRRTSSEFNALELLNINVSNTNKSNNSNHSNKSSNANNTAIVIDASSRPTNKSFMAPWAAGTLSAISTSSIASLIITSLALNISPKVSSKKAGNEPTSVAIQTDIPTPSLVVPSISPTKRGTRELTQHQQAYQVLH